MIRQYGVCREVHAYFLRTNKLHDTMKEKITYAICAVLLVAGFAGMQSVAESNLPALASVGILAGIIAALLAVCEVINKAGEETR